MRGRIHRGSIVIEEPSIEDLSMRMRRVDERMRRVDDDDRYKKKKSVFEDPTMPFLLCFQLNSAEIINSLYPWPIGSYYIVAWVDPNVIFETPVYELKGGPPDLKMELRTVVEPGWRYLFLEVVQVDALHDLESSEHNVVVGRARVQLQNFRPIPPEKYASRVVSVPLVKVYGGVGGDIRYKFGWEILGHISILETTAGPLDRFIRMNGL